MNKGEFLRKLENGLSALPQEDRAQWVDYYAEMIDDRMEDGLSEADAVAAIGNAEEIMRQIMLDTPSSQLAQTKRKPNRTLRMWEIVLLVLGAPVWLSLFLAAFAVILSIYVVWWSAVVSLWAVFASVIGGALGGVLSGMVFVFGGPIRTGIALIGAGIVCAGLSIFLFYGCKAVTGGTLFLTKKMVLGMIKSFRNKEKVS